MRILAIGDIHGCSRALDVLLAQVMPRPEDLLITLGDYVDRGPDSRGVLDRLIALYAGGRLIALRGNHDEMIVAAREGFDRRMWLACGGRTTLASYQVKQSDAGRFPEVPRTHWDFLISALQDYYEIDTHFFVHGSVYPDVPLAEQPTHMLYWEKLFDPVPHCSGKIMVCGHTRQLSGLPLNLGHSVCIDTGAYQSGWLTCLDVLSNQYWQANQKGETRMGELEETEWDPATGE